MSKCNIFLLLHRQTSENSSDIAWTTGIIIMLFSPITIIRNGLVVVSVLHDPFKNIKNAPSSFIILNLALADLMVGSISGPVFSVSLIHIAAYEDNDPFLGKITVLTVVLSTTVSLYSLIFLTVDRLIAIKTPLQYKSRMTKKRIRIINVLMWIFSMILAVIVVARCSQFVFVIITGTHAAIALAVLTALNGTIIFAARAQAKKIKKKAGLENQVVLQNAFTRERAVTRTALIMVMAFQVCLLPYDIFVFGVTLLKEITDLNLGTNILLWFYDLGTALAMFNSLMNPFLYACRLPKYRKVFQYLFTLIKKKLIAAVQFPDNTTLQIEGQNHNTSSFLQISASPSHIISNLALSFLKAWVEKQ